MGYNSSGGFRFFEHHEFSARFEARPCLGGQIKNLKITSGSQNPCTYIRMLSLSVVSQPSLAWRLSNAFHLSKTTGNNLLFCVYSCFEKGYRMKASSLGDRSDRTEWWYGYSLKWYVSTQRKSTDKFGNAFDIKTLQTVFLQLFSHCYMNFSETFF